MAVEHTRDAVGQGSKLKAVTGTMSPAEQPRVAAARAAAQQAPANLPATGGTGGIEANWVLVLGVALLGGLGLLLMRVARRV